MKKKWILLILFAMMLVGGSLAEARRGGGGGGFFRRSTRSVSRGSSRGFGFGSLIYIGSNPVFLVLLVGGAMIYFFMKKKGESGDDGTLFHAQLGFFFNDGELQKELMSIFNSIDTETETGTQTLLREVSVLMNRNWEQVRWFHYNRDSYSNQDALEGAFNKRVTEERMKLDKEEYSNIQGRVIGGSSDEPNLEEAIILNVIVASFSDVKLEKRENLDELKELLKFFASLSSEEFAGASVWWNILDRDDLIELYPELRQF